MNTVKVNNELTLTYPDGFEEMGEEELQRYFTTAKNRWGVFDAERHVILTVSWKKAGIFGFLVDPESVIVSKEAQMKRTLINYRRTSGGKTRIASKKKKNAYGIRFEYRVNNANIYQTGDLRTFKVKGRFYSIQYLARRINDEEYHPLFDALIDSIGVGK